MRQWFTTVEARRYGKDTRTHAHSFHVKFIAYFGTGISERKYAVNSISKCIESRLQEIDNNVSMGCSHFDMEKKDPSPPRIVYEFSPHKEQTLSTVHQALFLVRAFNSTVFKSHLMTCVFVRSSARGFLLRR